MRPSSIFFLAAQLSAVWALPTAPAPATSSVDAGAAKPGAAKAGAAKAGEKASGAAEGAKEAGGAKKEGEEKKDERDIAGQFGVAVALEAGATKQDVKFPPGVRLPCCWEPKHLLLSEQGLLANITLDTVEKRRVRGRVPKHRSGPHPHGDGEQDPAAPSGRLRRPRAVVVQGVARRGCRQHHAAAD